MKHFRIVAAFLILLTTYPLAGQKLSQIAPNISLTVYELEDYVRHPRMEEEDRLRGGNAAYRPGLEIICDVQEAEIRFFEEVVGRTPMEWDNLAAGAYRVRIERTGYEVQDFWVQVLSDRRSVVYVEMGSPQGTLKINNLPEGAKVSLDRFSIEGSEALVDSGIRQLKISIFGREPVVETVTIPAGGILEWTYSAPASAFSLSVPKSRPGSLPAGDRRGFTIDWTSSAPGDGKLMIYGPTGKEYHQETFDISSYNGTIYWIPSGEVGGDFPEGRYRIVVSGTGTDGGSDTAESALTIDNRFKRDARPVAHLLPGLMYAPGSAILPPGIWQVSTSVQYDIDSSPSKFFSAVPVYIGLRVSPAPRWEISGRFGMRARDPFDTTSISFSLSGSWRMNPGSGPFEANLSLLYLHEGLAVDMAAIPMWRGGTGLPGLQLTVPMEYSIGDVSFVLSPAANLFFPGDDPALWRLSSPARFAGFLGTGAYWENGRFLLGFSSAVRTPDLSGKFLDWTMWSALEGRLDLPGDASYLAIWSGIRYLNINPVVSVGIEFGVIR